MPADQEQTLSQRRLLRVLRERNGDFSSALPQKLKASWDYPDHHCSTPSQKQRAGSTWMQKKDNEIIICESDTLR